MKPLIAAPADQDRQRAAAWLDRHCPWWVQLDAPRRDALPQLLPLLETSSPAARGKSFLPLAFVLIALERQAWASAARSMRQAHGVVHAGARGERLVRIIEHGARPRRRKQTLSLEAPQ